MYDVEPYCRKMVPPEVKAERVAIGKTESG
jgi:hypothetical protein